jgi:predicted RNA binding protein YcfA (HicA-like mRNA interferase family)
MPKIPEIKPKQLQKFLVKLGFIPRQGKGSHIVFKHPDGRRTVVANHTRPISSGTLRAILRQIKLSVVDFLEMM